MATENFKVIVVGGSIAGLSLAHCLHRAGIEYVVLEKHGDIAPQLGASVGVLPNGGRILDQLGLYDAVEELIAPLRVVHITQPDGSSFSSNYPKVFNDRFGYPLAFLDRQKLLEILYTSLPSTDNIHLNAEVVRIELQAKNAVVHTKSGVSYKGDLVVGADGIRSCARSAMWGISPTITEQDQSTMTVEYACVFGISSPLEGLETGQQITCFNDGWSVLSVIGKGGRIYWFLMLKVDQKYPAASAPRFTRDDAIKECEARVRAHYWGGITFGDVWKARQVFSITALEEGLLQTWHTGRLVCIGDSVHKMAPNTGQGANSAIEDAAALTNLLRATLSTGQKPSTTDLDTILHNFSRARIDRMKLVCESAGLAVRLHARDGLVKQILGRWALPYAGDFLANKASQGVSQAVALNFLPLPARSGAGWGVAPSGRGRVQLASIGAVILLGLLIQWNGAYIRY